MGNQYQSEGRGPHEGGTVMIVRLSADEKRRVQRDAKRAGLSMSQHVRARLGLEPPAEKASMADAMGRDGLRATRAAVAKHEQVVGRLRRKKSPRAL